MTALRHVEVPGDTVDTSADDAEPQDTKRGSLATLESAPKNLTYRIVHSTNGRLRLKVSNLRFDFEQASACLVSMAQLRGILGLRLNSWCASAVIDYDASIWNEKQLLNYLDDIVYGEQSDIVHLAMPVYRKPLPLPWLRQSAQFILEYLSPGLQVAIGAMTFAAAIFDLPLLLTKLLITASTVPIVCRATLAIVDERKIGIDSLDAVAASVMLFNGKLNEVAFMTALIATGEFIRERTSRQCEKLVSDLLGLSGRSAWLIRGKKRVRVPADEVKVGEQVVVYPGDMIPVDGTVLTGEAAIDQSTLTGESFPREVQSGDKVFASTVAVEGKIYIVCQATGSETRAGQVLACVTNAPISETKIQNHASQLADRMVVPIFIASGICFAITRDVGRLMSMLILDFCTGIRIAAPTAVLSSMHRAGRRGILIKSGAALEKLASVSAIVFDKTGTLTSGEPKVEEVARFNGHTEQQILSYAAAVEMRLHHPAARAIVKAAQQQGLDIPERGESDFIRGMGAKATVESHTVIVGSKNLLMSEGIQLGETRDSELRAINAGESISYVAIDGKVAGLIRYADRIRPEVARAIKQLKRLRVRKLVMATGDIPQSAQRIANSCGITEIIAQAFPEDKAVLVQKLKAQGHTVAVIGDGINDSPALAYADVAISLHGATDAAQQSADVILTDDNLERLPEAIRIARSAMGLVQQNLVMCVAPNGAGLAMAALGMIGPAGATVLNNGSAIAAAVNSLRPLYSNSWSQVEPVKPVK